MPDRTEIRSWVRTQTLLETDDVSNAQVDAIINQGIRYISTQFRWPYLAASTTINFVAAQQAYALPAGVATLEKVMVTGSRLPLTEVTAALAWEEMGDDFRSSTVPTHYFIWGREINFVPIPSASAGSAKLFYYMQPTILANDSESPEWASEFHLILAEYVAAKLWEREEDYSKAEEHKSAFSAMMNDMARYYLNPVEDYPTVYGGGRRGNQHLNYTWLDAP